MINKNSLNSKKGLIRFFVIYMTIVAALSLLTLTRNPIIAYETAESSTQYDGSKTVAGQPTSTNPLRTGLPSATPPNSRATFSPAPSIKISPTVAPSPTMSYVAATPAPTSTQLNPTLMATSAATSGKTSLSQVLLALLTILSFAGIVISIILLVANKIKRNRIKPYLIALLISLAIFIISALFFISVG